MDLEKDSSITKLGSQFASKTRANLITDTAAGAGGGCGFLNYTIMLL